MDDLGGILILLGFTAFAIALFSFFKPLPKLKLATKRGSAVLVALSAASCIAGGALMPKPDVPVENVAKAPASQAAAPQDAQIEREANALWAQVVAISRDCDALATGASSAIDELLAGSINVYGAYDAATQAERACKAAARDLGVLDPPPSSTGAVRGEFRGVVAVCAATYKSKAAAFTHMLTILNGDSSPASVQKFKDEHSRSQAGTLYCPATFIDAAKAAGIPAEKLKLEG